MQTTLENGMLKNFETFKENQESKSKRSQAPQHKLRGNIIMDKNNIIGGDYEFDLSNQNGIKDLRKSVGVVKQDRILV